MAAITSPGSVLPTDEAGGALHINTQGLATNLKANEDTNGTRDHNGDVLANISTDTSDGVASPTKETFRFLVDSKSLNDFNESPSADDTRANAMHDIALCSPPHSRDSGTVSRPWKTTIIRFGPLSGVLCMLLALVSIVAALGILVGSNGADIASWRTPPSTYLAILTAAANLSIRYACVQGVVIAWWYRASKGTTLAKLHHDWRSGSTLRGALTAGRHMGLLGLACIASTLLVVVDGPLLQRASIVRTLPYTNQTIPLNVSMAQEIPRFPTRATWNFNSELGIPYFWSYAFNATVPTGGNTSASNSIYATFSGDEIGAEFASLVSSDAPLYGVVRGCADTCKAKIRAPALAATICTSKAIKVNYSMSTLQGAHHVIADAPPLNQQTFEISIGLALDRLEKIWMGTGYYQGEDCVGVFNQTSCTLESAVGEYDITIRDGIAHLDDPGHPNIVALANNTAANYTNDPILGGHPSTLADIVYKAFPVWDTVSALYYTRGVGMTMNSAGGYAAEGYFLRDEDHCPSYRDPTEDVVASLNKMMVWMGMVSATRNASYQAYLQAQTDPGLPMHTQVTGNIVGSHAVFWTDFGFFVAAALVEVFCIAVIAPIYWGWWTLGRHVSFSPLEIAKAFDSSLLINCNSNSHARDMARTYRDCPIQYGARKDHQSNETFLTFAHPEGVTSPTPGTRFI